MKHLKKFNELNEATNTAESQADKEKITHDPGSADKIAKQILTPELRKQALSSPEEGMKIIRDMNKKHPELAWSRVVWNDFLNEFYDKFEKFFNENKK